RRLVRALRGTGVPRGRHYGPRPGTAPPDAHVPRRRARQMKYHFPIVDSRRALSCAALALSLALPLSLPAAAPAAKKPLTTAEVLSSSSAADWRALDPQDTLYMELPAGRVIIELAPVFAPHHVANVIALVRGHYFDGLAIMR